MNRSRSQRGSVLLLTMIFMLLAASVGYTLIMTTGGEVSRAGNRRRSAQALINAESGLAEIKGNPGAHFQQHITRWDEWGDGDNRYGYLSSPDAATPYHYDCGMVVYRDETQPPAGVSLSLFRGLHFDVQVTGYGTAPAEGVACDERPDFSRRVNEGVVVIVPRGQR